MRNIAIVITLSIIQVGCAEPSLKFDPRIWHSSEELLSDKKVRMVKHITDKIVPEGTHFADVESILGRGEFVYNNENRPTLSYVLQEYYDADIDPTGREVLFLEFSEDSLLIDHEQVTFR